jgi:hypothetical protein
MILALSEAMRGGPTTPVPAIDRLGLIDYLSNSPTTEWRRGGSVPHEWVFAIRSFRPRGLVTVRSTVEGAGVCDPMNQTGRRGRVVYYDP